MPLKTRSRTGRAGDAGGLVWVAVGVIGRRVYRLPTHARPGAKAGIEITGSRIRRIIRTVQGMANDLQWSGAGDPGRRLGRTVEFHPTIGSTNDRAWELLGQGDEGTAVVADLQTAGRGRRGRTWSSPPGVNLMVSVGIRPNIPAADAWLLG